MQSLRKIGYLSIATFTEGIRHRALWVIVGLAILLTMANIGFTTLFSWDLGKVSIEFGLSAIAFSGLLLIFFLGLRILADDIERNRIFMLLSRPVSTWQYLSGKFLGLGMILFVITIILGISASLSMYYILWHYPAFVPPNFSWITYLMALVCQWIQLIVVLSISVFFFSLTNHSFTALFLSMAAYLIGQSIELFRRIVVENTHAGILAGQTKIVVFLSWIFPNLSLFDKKYVAAYGMAFSFHEFFFLCSYGLSYSILMIYLATILFNRNKMK